MIDHFPTSEALHLLHHGVTKKLLSLWMDGSNIYNSKWPKREIPNINRMFYQVCKEMPSDIPRSIRNLDYLSNWKATEYRCFLMYTGIVILKDFLQAEEYEHFLTLSSAVRFCSSDFYVRNTLSLAKELFEDFVEEFINIYGQNEVVSNVHNLLHVHEDVQHFGNLNSFSAYEFENALRFIGLQIQTSKAPLEQISRRLSEIAHEFQLSNMNCVQMDSSDFTPQFKYQMQSRKPYFTYNFISISANTFLSTKKNGDRWFITKRGVIVKMMHAQKSDGKYLIFGAPLKQKKEFFIHPLPSRYLDIYISNGETKESIFFDISEIRSKLMCLSYKNDFVFIPLLHSLDEQNKISLPN